jgi:hypothetical protein
MRGSRLEPVEKRALRKQKGVGCLTQYASDQDSDQSGTRLAIDASIRRYLLNIRQLDFDIRQPVI